MIDEHYPYWPSGQMTYFMFKSMGPKGTIHKIVRFSHVQDDVWNGDLKHGEIDFKANSNNQDIAKVIGTVAKLARAFLETYPERTIQIVPADEKRRQFYNIVIQRHWQDFDGLFLVLGLCNDDWEPVSFDKAYDEFRVSLKP